MSTVLSEFMIDCALKGVTPNRTLLAIRELKDIHTNVKTSINIQKVAEILSKISITYEKYYDKYDTPNTIKTATEIRALCRKDLCDEYSYIDKLY